MKSIIIIVVIVCVTLLGGCDIINKKNDSVNDKEVSEEAKRLLELNEMCNNLSEEECYENELCIGIFGPSSCGDGYCTADIRYKGCKVSGLTEEEYQELVIECEANNGELKKRYPEGYYVCECVNY